MRLNLREISQRPDVLTSGHNLCPGCMESVVVRQVLQVTGPNTVVATATGCLSVSTTPYPFTAWRVPWIHSLFANAGATISGVEAAYKSLIKTGRLDDTQPITSSSSGATEAPTTLAFNPSVAPSRGDTAFFTCA